MPSTIPPVVVRRCGLLAGLVLWPLLLRAQPAPARPLTLVVGYAPGGSVDLVARALAPGLARRLGQPVQVQNIAGASGTLGAVMVALAAPDGLTLLLGSPSEVGINHLTARQHRFDPQTDLSPIALIGSQPMVLVAGPAAPAGGIDGLIAQATARPGQLRYGSAGAGTPLHLAGETIRQRAGIDIRHVPYRGAGLLLPELLAGRVEYAVMVLSSALPLLRDGRLRALGVTTAARSAAAPQLPALSEHPRLQAMDLGVWFGVLAPRQLPAALAERLAAELRALLKEPGMRHQLQTAGLVLMEDTPFAPFLQREVRRFQQVIAAMPG